MSLPRIRSPPYPLGLDFLQILNCNSFSMELKRLEKKLRGTGLSQNSAITKKKQIIQWQPLYIINVKIPKISNLTKKLMRVLNFKPWRAEPSKTITREIRKSPHSLLANNLCGRSSIFQPSPIYKLQPRIQVNRRWPALSDRSNYPVINVCEMTGDGWDWVLSRGTAGRRTTRSRIRPFTGHSRHCGVRGSLSGRCIVSDATITLRGLLVLPDIVVNRFGLVNISSFVVRVCKMDKLNQRVVLSSGKAAGMTDLLFYANLWQDLKTCRCLYC